MLVGGHQAAYLIGHAAGGALPASAVRHAFIGALQPQLLAEVVGADTLLCAASDAQQPFCSSLQAEAQAGSAAEPTLHLDAAALQELLHRHPDAVLVDVRESHEHLVGTPAALSGGKVVSVPLGQLAGQIPAWMAAPVPVPLVFFCRSGNRSARAAQCLRRPTPGALGQCQVLAAHLARGESQNQDHHGRRRSHNNHEHARVID
eukprot:gene3001-3533_t